MITRRRFVVASLGALGFMALSNKPTRAYAQGARTPDIEVSRRLDGEVEVLDKITGE